HETTTASAFQTPFSISGTTSGESGFGFRLFLEVINLGKGCRGPVTITHEFVGQRLQVEGPALRLIHRLRPKRAARLVEITGLGVLETERQLRQTCGPGRHLRNGTGELIRRQLVKQYLDQRIDEVANGNRLRDTGGVRI